MENLPNLESDLIGDESSGNLFDIQLVSEKPSCEHKRQLYTMAKLILFIRRVKDDIREGKRQAIYIVGLLYKYVNRLDMEYGSESAIYSSNKINILKRKALQYVGEVRHDKDFSKEDREFFEKNVVPEIKQFLCFHN